MPTGFRVYNALLFGALVAVLATHPIWDEPVSVAPAWAWFGLVVIFLVAERADLNFYDERARFGLSTSEAIVFPMVMASTFTGLVWGVTLAMTLERASRRVGVTKAIFNISSFGCSIAVAGWIWGGLNDGSVTFTIQNAAAGFLAIAAFGLLTHIFTVIAIALAEGGSVIGITRSLAPATVTSFSGGIVVGLLFAASFESAPWTVFLFPVVIGAFYFGFRAVVRQAGERERLEALHAATRALVAGPGIAEAIAAFLAAVGEIASAGRAVVVLRSSGHLRTTHPWMYSEVNTRGKSVPLRPLSNGPLVDLAEYFDGPAEWLGVRKAPADGPLGDELGAAQFVAVPVKVGGAPQGVLAVFDRVGADEFDEDDATMLEALANELSVSLDSYRLFHEVMEERERFGRIFSGSKEGICLLDGDGYVRAWNPALEKISGYTSDDVMDRVWSDVVTIRNRDEDRVQGNELVGVEAEDELELVTRAGPSRWVTVLAGPVGDAEGGGWVVLLRDVTAEHEVEQAKSDFLSTISHELRTPLTTIKGALQVLGRGPDSLPEGLTEQMITVTSRGAARLERLVMNLLAVSQIESGMMHVFPDAVDLSGIVQECIDALLGDHRQTSFKAPDEPIVVGANRERLSHVVEHVLENAQKFGGPEGRIAIEITQDVGFAHLAVTDEGPGIPTSDQDRIFERFVRLGDILTRETQGAGIGLFIAKQSTEAMGGRIWVDSKPGTGSTFHVTIPMAHPMVVSGEAAG